MAPVRQKSFSLISDREYIIESQSEWKRPFDFRIRNESIADYPLWFDLRSSRRFLGEIIVIYEIVSCVIRRIDVNQLDLAEYVSCNSLSASRLSPSMNRFLLCRNPRSRHGRAERLGDGGICSKDCFPLSRPVEAIAFRWPSTM